MKHIFTNVTVIDKASSYHKKVVNILVNGDQILAIGNEVTDEKAKVIDMTNYMVSPGWVEMHANFADPGFEEREDIQSGAKAAAAGGFTSVALVPSTNPVVQTKSDVEYVIKKGDETAINIFPLGALSKNQKGEDITEMFDMHRAGAVAFYDDKKAVKNPNLLKTALLYAQNIAPVMLHPRHPDLTLGGQMNEGETSTFLGMRGMPSIAEELMIARDLFIASYTNSPVHFTGVSSAGSVTLLREAIEKGQNVTADVNFYNLIFTDSALTEYDTNFKLNPPLRTQEDVDALIEGLKDGTISAICTDHNPMDIEQKRCEFENASFGMGAIESAFSALMPIIKKIGIDTFIEKISTNPRAILDLPKIKIVEGAVAELTFFSTIENTTLEKKKAFSKAANNPFLGQELTGKVIGVFNNSKYVPSHA